MSLAKIGRWYRRGDSYRCPLSAHDDGEGFSRVRYRFPLGQVTACPGIAWINWARKAELMPEDFRPPKYREIA